MQWLRDYLFPLAQGAKISPQDLAGFLGLPYVGNIYYIDATNGNDNNTGQNPRSAVKTVKAAHALMSAYQHDVAILISGGTNTGAGTSETTAVDWSKSFCHLIGAAAPNVVGGRARIVDGSTAGLPIVFTVSGNGCIISNVQIATFKAGGLVDVLVSGDRNVFSGVHFAGIGEATAGDDASARSLKVTGDENRFLDCVIGLDTVPRSTTNAELELSGGATRNKFINCDIVAYADNAGHFFVKAPDAASIDRYAFFDGCNFINPINSAATAMTDAMDLHEAVGGSIILKDCLKIGATGWADDLTNVQALGVSSNSTYNQGIGFAVNPAA